MREVFARACERRFGPRSDWTSQQRKAFEHDFHALLCEMEAPPGTRAVRVQPVFDRRWGAGHATVTPRGLMVPTMGLDED